MPALMFLLLLSSVACKLQIKSAGTKKLQREQGRFREPSQVEKDMRKQRSESINDIRKLCGRGLDDVRWVEDESIPYHRGFLFATVRPKKACHDQNIIISIKAVRFMQAKSIRCNKSSDGYFIFEIPSSPNYDDIIKVTCETKFIDLRSNSSSLTITTLEKNGGSNLAEIDAFGKWNGYIKRVSEGIGQEELLKLTNSAEKAIANGDLNNIKAIEVVRSGIVGAVATGPTSLMLAAAGAGASVMVLPAIGIAIGIVAYIGYKKIRPRDKMNLYYATALIRRSLTVMLSDA